MEMGAPRWNVRGRSRTWSAALGLWMMMVAGTTGAHAEETRAYADIRGTGVDAFASLADVREGTVDRHVPGTTFVAVRENSAKVAGVTYHKTDQGWIPAKALIWKTPSEFVGIDLRASAPAFPFAWVLPAKRSELVPARAEPGRRAPVVRELGRRELVPVHEQDGSHTRIGDGEWVESVRLRIARTALPPDGLEPGERWIDIDLDQQVLIAYEGDVPVYATLVSSGRKKWRTPPGVYRIRSKTERTRMRSPDGFGVSWNVAEVPWSMSFRKHFALHGAYWHDGFGVARSHGCINLAIADAELLYAWTHPAIDAEPHTGTVIRIRNKRTPDPPWRDWDGDVLDPVAP
jgi:hypothetical protein